jgi:triacylglycerol esterase/lipase EstA (alpha/beta hydrolase family)
MTKLILFIHGLGGTADGTWKKFPQLLREDASLADHYDVATFEYPTGAFGSKPSLPICAASLKTEIENRYPAYSDIALIAHSQGGLVARSYIAERLNSEQPLRGESSADLRHAAPGVGVRYFAEVGAPHQPTDRRPGP